MANEIDLVKEFESLKVAIKNAATELENFMTKAKGDGTGNFKGQEEALNRIISLEKQLVNVQNQLINSSKQNTTVKTAETQAQIQYQNALKKQAVINQEIQTETVKVTQAIKDKTRALREDYMLSNASPYEKLKNEVRLASLAYMNMAASLGVNDINVVKAQKSLGLLNEKLSRIEQNAGNYKRNVGNYSSATFTLTQVLREAPAFAYGAQIGFGALSNNLVPLAAAFQEVSKSVNISTRKINGAWGAFKIFGAQLFGLNAIMSIGVLIMTMYGKEIGTWVKSLFTATEATLEFTTAQKELYEQTSKLGNSTHTTTAQVELLGVELMKWSKNENNIQKDTRNTSALIENYNSVLGDYAGRVDNVNDALIGYQKYAKEYIQWTIQMNAATELASKAGDQLLRKQSAQRAISSFDPKNVEEVRKSIEEIGGLYQQYYLEIAKNEKGSQLTAEETSKAIKKSNIEWFKDLEKADFGKTGGNLFTNLRAYWTDLDLVATKSRIADKIGQVQDKLENVEGYKRIALEIKNIMGASKGLDAYTKASLEVLPNLYTKIDKAKGAGRRQKEEKSYKAEEDHYNRLIILLNSYSQALLDIANNELASFDSRTNAANTWFNNNQELYIEELKLEKAKNKTIYEEALESLEKTKNANIKNGYSILEQEEKFNKNLNIIKNNQLLANQKADDIWYKKSINNEKSRTDKLLDIADDYYKVLEEKRKEDLSRQDRELNERELQFNEIITKQLMQQKAGFASADRIIKESEDKRSVVAFSADLKRIENKKAALLKEKEALIKYYDEIAGISKEKDYDLLKQKIDAQAEADKERLKHSGLTDQEIADKSKEIDEQAIIDKQKFSDDITAIKTAEAEAIKDINKELADSEIEEINRVAKEKERQAKEDEERAKKLAKDTESLNNDILNTSIEAVEELVNSIYEIKYKKLQEEKDLYSLIEDEKNKEINDKLKAGVLNEEQAEEQKAANKAYYQSVQDDLDKIKEEKKRQEFLLSQSFAVGEIAVNTAVNITKAPELTALYLGLAAAQVAVVLAQTIPQFKDGVKDFEGGTAIVNDGIKNGQYVPEVIVEPNKQPYMLKGANVKKDFAKGTNIYPNINAFEKEKSLSLFYSVNDNQFSDRMIIRELREQTKALVNNRPIIRKNNTFDLMAYANKISNKKTNPLRK